MNFAIDYFAVGIVLAFLGFVFILKIFLFKKAHSPALYYSRLSDLKHLSWRVRWTHLPNFLHYLSLILLVIAFLNPQIFYPQRPTTKKNSSTAIPTEGIAMYIVLDQSGSMGQAIKAIDNEGKAISTRKIDLLKQVTEKFILSHPSDLIGLVSFSRVPTVMTPLTLERNELIHRLNQIQTTQRPEEDGTAMGYAIYKTAYLLSSSRQLANELKEKGKAPYTINSGVVIVVTDGFQNPSRLDQGNALRTLELDDAATYAKSQGIRLYVINIDPSLQKSQFAPERRQLQSITASTGGQFFTVDDPKDLQGIYSSIDTLEKGWIEQKVQTDSLNSNKDYLTVYLFPYFLYLGMSLLFLSLLLSVTIFRVVP